MHYIFENISSHCSVCCFFSSNFCSSNVAVLVFNVFKFQIIIILFLVVERMSKKQQTLRSVT